jgi:hypothetical protein
MLPPESVLRVTVDPRRFDAADLEDWDDDDAVPAPAGVSRGAWVARRLDLPVFDAARFCSGASGAAACARPGAGSLRPAYRSVKTRRLPVPGKVLRTRSVWLRPRLSSPTATLDPRRYSSLRNPRRRPFSVMFSNNGSLHLPDDRSRTTRVLRPLAMEQPSAHSATNIIAAAR